DHHATQPRDQDQADVREHGHALHGPVQARPAQPVHPGRAAAQPQFAEHGGRGLHAALHPGARGPQSDHRVRGPQASAARGGRRVPGGRRDGHRQPQERARRIRRQHPGDPADGAGRRGRRHGRRLPRLAGDRRHALPGLPPPAQRAHQPDPAPGAGHQRADRLRRRGGVSRRRDRRRPGRRGGHPREDGRRSGRRGGADDRFRGLRAGGSAQGPQHPGAVSRDRSEDEGRLHGLAQGQRSV
ncbi:MAG: Demethylmenaquinone methyltransferase-like protein, partial [uncultured Ramlibacter sp.]